jgi:dihydroxy-acid dehydratase
VSPEAAVGGPLALVESGDRIRLSVRDRRVDLDVETGELERRKKRWQAPELPARGYRRLYAERVMQAENGCDFDFLLK